MADIFDFYVYDDRSIQFAIAEPIMLEDKDVTQFRFRIPKVLNNIDMTDWEWWFIFVNAKKMKYTTQLTLDDDEDDPDNFSVATYTVGYGFSGYVGQVSFSIEALNVSGDSIVNEWHTRTYNTHVIDTLQGTRAVIPEPEADAGTGLTAEEKSLILELFSKAAYAEDDASTAYDRLEALWTIITRLVSLNLSHVTSSNQSASVENGSRYVTNLTADTNYSINEVTVTMGGVDITSTAYSSGTVSIPSVTGNIVITATAVLTAQSITATYTQSGTVYDTDSLDSLKADLVVTANYAGGTSETVPASDYTLSGTLTVGTSTITVSYGGKTGSFNVTVTQSPLYPLTTGEKIWTSEDRKVSVRDGNIVKGELRSGGSSDMHANISWLSLNGSTPNDTDNNKVGTSKLFTIPSGSSVSIKVTPLTVQYENAQIGGRSTNIAMRDSTGTNLHTLLGTTAYNTLTVGTPVTDSFTASADLDVWNITMWMQAYSGNKTCTLELEIELTVDGVRFI